MASAVMSTWREGSDDLCYFFVSRMVETGAYGTLVKSQHADWTVAPEYFVSRAFLAAVAMMVRAGPKKKDA